MSSKFTLIILIILLCISMYFINRHYSRCVYCDGYDDSPDQPYGVCKKCKEEIKKTKERSDKMKNIY